MNSGGTGALLLAAVAACLGGGASAGWGEDDAAPGIHELTLSAAGREAAYTVLVPQGYRRDRPAPLVLALHFGGKITPFYGRNVLEILVAPALAELGAIIVAPDALDGS